MQRKSNPPIVTYFAACVACRAMYPSGRKVRLMANPEKAWPWAAVETGYVWHVCRDHGIDGRPSTSLYFDSNKPLQLDEGDARALANALNRMRCSSPVSTESSQRLRT